MRFHTSTPIVSLVLVLLSTTAVFAAEIPLQSKIDAVTVFADGATVQRTAKLAIPQGEHVLVLAGLPDSIDPDTLRVTGEGLAGLTVTSVDTRLVPGPAQDTTSYTTKRKALADALETARGKQEAANAQKNSMLKFSQALPAQLAGEKSPLEVDKWPAAWSTIAQGIERVNGDLRLITLAIADLDAEIQALDAAQAA